MFEEELLELLKEFYETEKFEFTENTKDCISEVLIYKKRDMKKCRSLAWTMKCHTILKLLFTKLIK